MQKLSDIKSPMVILAPPRAKITIGDLIDVRLFSKLYLSATLA